MSERPTVTLPAKVEQVIPPIGPGEPEKVRTSRCRGRRCAVPGEFSRIENTLTDENGDEVRLKEGAEVEVTVEADKTETELANNEK